jgi:hypothetical protein
MKLDDPDNIAAYCKRFKWIDSDTIKLANTEGIEKLVDLRKGFEEIAFATVPIRCEQEHKHYYDFRGSFEIGPTLDRLKY